MVNHKYNHEGNAKLDQHLAKGSSRCQFQPKNSTWQLEISRYESCVKIINPHSRINYLIKYHSRKIQKGILNKRDFFYTLLHKPHYSLISLLLLYFLTLDCFYNVNLLFFKQVNKTPLSLSLYIYIYNII